jgi:outer membrane lipoprotein-sorting protein
MKITDRYGIKAAEFTAWGRGRDRTLIEFTSGEERGRKILRTEKEIYLYYPDAEEVIRLQGAALRESVLGSDLSYQDIAGDKGLLETFKVRLLGGEKVGDRDCHKLELEAKTRDTAYPRQTIWVDTELYILRAGLYYALSGRLLKELRVLETMRTGGKTIPSRMVMEDKLKGNSSTEFVIRKADLAARVPASKFSLEELSW